MILETVNVNMQEQQLSKAVQQDFSWSALSSVRRSSQIFNKPQSLGSELGLEHGVHLPAWPNFPGGHKFPMHEVPPGTMLARIIPRISG
jgi:hypothetical protein